FDQCQIDKSGRWLVIRDDVDGIAGYDTRIVDLETGAERVLLGQKGGGGQLDTGYGYMIAADRWNARPGALRVWSFEEDPLQGTVAEAHGDGLGGPASRRIPHGAGAGVRLDRQPGRPGRSHARPGRGPPQSRAPADSHHLAGAADRGLQPSQRAFQGRRRLLS